MGNIKHDSDWFPNLITNQGLDQMNDHRINVVTNVGTGSTPAAFTDIQMETFLASSWQDGAGNEVSTPSVAPNYEISTTTSARFDADEAIGLITEIALGNDPVGADGTEIWNHVIIPTPVNKGADNILDVLFRVTYWPWITDVNSQSTVDAKVYNTITRGRHFPLTPGSGTMECVYYPFSPKTSYASYNAYDGNIGATILDNTPSGAYSDPRPNFAVNELTYQIGTYYQDIVVFAGLEGWWLSNGIRSLVGALHVKNHGWQTQFNAVSDGGPIMKLDTQIMNFSWRYGWGRK
jgi:hypothetical protein